MRISPHICPEAVNKTNEPLSHESRTAKLRLELWTSHIRSNPPTTFSYGTDVAAL